jgi:hypothetical protein
MRRFWALLATITVLGAAPQAFQGGARGATAASATGACAILTKELLAAHTPAAPESFRLMTSVPPTEDKAGANGTMCSFGGVTLQIDPFSAASVPKLVQKDWVMVKDLGDAAYFRANRSYYAELLVTSGARVVTIQMSVPSGRTPQEIQPNTIGLAKAILAKLK